MGKGTHAIHLTAVFIVLLIDCSKADAILFRIEKGIKDILDKISEKDNFQDIKELLHIDTTLKNIEKQNEDISKHLMSSIGRSGVGTGDAQHLEIRIDTLEDNVVSNVQGGIKKMDDVQKQTNAIKSEMEKRLGKMMNLMTTVYQLNEKISSRVEQGPSTNDDSQNQVAFMTERMDDLEKVVSESVSIMKQTLMSEIRSIKSELLEPFAECKELASQVEDMKSKCDGSSKMTIDMDLPGWETQPDKEHLVKDITEKIMRNLTRVQREISANLTKKIQDLEMRLSETTTHKPFIEFRESSPKATITRAPRPAITIKPPVVVPERSQSNGEKKMVVDDCRSLKYNLSQPQNCWELKQAGASCNGPYIIYPKGVKAVYAYCDMIKSEGGWTVIMRRGDFGGQPVNFNQNWKAYKEGFGDINSEFWLGNENIRMLTSGQETMLLHVALEAFDGNHIDIVYDQFWIESEESHYRMHLGNVNGSTTYQGSSLRHHNGRPFSTHDKNNGEIMSENCAARFRGGWWYNRCHYALLTAPYFKKDEFRHKWQGMQWHAWKGNEILKAAEMKIRPKTHF